MNYNLEYPERSAERIDKYICEQLPDLSRSYLQQLIKRGQVTVNGKRCKANYPCKPGDSIVLEYEEPQELDVVAENIPLDILYEDESVILINKPKNMVVHPAAGHYTGTLVNALLYHCKDSLSSINGVIRPGIVHRIDRNTTGILVVCKNDMAHKYIAEQLKEHSITRTYHAICYGTFRQTEGTINAPIGRHPVDRKKMAVNHKNGREAITHYRVLQTLKENFSYIECTLETGRTHQIRVHMASIGHPLLGDDVYGPKNPGIKGLEGQTLHAKTLGFIHPETGKRVEFDSELPEYFQQLLKKLS
ncbi:MAG: RluA family pseudouridine synthase [Bacteroidales bacterium]|nr:RluA family pseudouridine synthase [Clostridium sp.]MCM1204907.1 RluA family pseudouridine synthase [Bacteroidales bacterium]